ncbi:MAG: hypothetical protein JXR61_01750 [Prolixibacteraceae bacterium]|nr:hypothetical protein [Prolixibacteraceae bacterium]
MFEKLKKRWNIQSNFQVLIILIVFAINGTSTVYVKKVAFDLIGITAETNLWIKIPVYIVVVLSAYNLLLLIIGALFGQFKFFMDFEKKFFSRLIPKRKTTRIKNIK